MYLKITSAPLLPFKKSPLVLTISISSGLEQSLAFSFLSKAPKIPCL